MTTSESPSVSVSLSDSAKDSLSLKAHAGLWQRMQGLVAERVQADQLAAERYRSESARIERDYHAAVDRRSDTFEIERAAIQAEYDKAVIDAGTLFTEDYADAKREFDRTVSHVQSQAEEDRQVATKKHEEDRWMVTSYFDEEAEGSPRQLFEIFETNSGKTRDQLQIEADELDTTKRRTDELMQRRRQAIEVDPPKLDKIAPTNDLDTAAAQFRESCQLVSQHATVIENLKIPVLFQGLRPLAVATVAWLCLWGIGGFAVDPKILNLDLAQPEWLVLSGLVLWFPVGIAMWILLIVGRGQSQPIYELLFEQHMLAQRLRQRWNKLAEVELKERQEKFLAWQKVITAKREAGLRKADDGLAATMQQIEVRRVSEFGAAQQKYPALLNAITLRRDQQMNAAEEEFPQRLEKLKARFEWDLDKLAKQKEAEVAACTQAFQQSWLVMAQDWLDGWKQLQMNAAEANQRADEWFRDWNVVGAGPLQLPITIPPAIRLGSLALRLDAIPDGLPREDQLVPEQTGVSLPVCLPFPDEPSLLLKAADEGRAAAVSVMQNTMLRLLTTLPGGKVRFTILDPVGLGDNFAAFMHLADYDELLITSRIWTEQQQIEQRLADLTEHMENVFQKYLRNEFRSIQEYNVHAGEVAEPYHVLVVANFPANFSEPAARRLVSIATAGPRCGVFVLASVDTKMRMPLNFDLKDLESSSTVLNWSNTAGCFAVQNDDLKSLPLTLEVPPDPESFTRLVKAAGHESKDARRVEVAFERIAPKDSALWTGDSRGGLDVPLGRAGATKLQHLRLGKGTSQHVLIAGKTGSGKSTFLHILITNAALHYGPDQLQFYMIDFKKGVEFKTYATHELPHARVIAIESDREFGVSVLERLDAILKERGDLFRDVGVQDLSGFRGARPDQSMPRILLVVDEFQEFFVEDDKHSQTAALLLDRLVRQGRAFGIHVLLGSQTLGGAYSLARSTLGQMAVRIALQCSESDAHLILSEDNTAARLLTRPGEAIYNDANGMMEGNHPFQIAWLPDARRDHFLAKVQDLTKRSDLTIAPAIVFEGNIPADPRRNGDLSILIDSPQWDVPPAEQIAWLGEAVAIKDPTTVSFHPQGGQNLLVVGQSEAAAIGMLASSIISLACQVAPNHSQVALNHSREMTGDGPEMTMGSSASVPQFVILDGNFDGGSMQSWSQLQEALPHAVQIGEPRDVPTVLEMLTAEMSRRETSGSRDESPIFFVVFNVGRFRDLRKSDDDMGFSFGGSEKKKASPSKMFTDLLKNGPGLGIHSLVWSDTYNNVSRWFSSQMLREFELRVVFQMSMSDSSNLIDSPLAGRLGTNRAILHLVDQGSNEKFRPYGPPPADWLIEIADRWHNDQPNESLAEPVEVGEDLSQFTIL